MSLRIILVRPSHPGNIGAAARAMKTMGLSELFLVTPKYFPDDQATAMAAHAQTLLEKAVVTQTLSEALTGISHVYATSANLRTADLPAFTARDAVKHMQHHAKNARIALIFGPENHGLSNADLHFAHYLVNIPTASVYHSLNLAAAVQILSYEWFLAENKGETAMSATTKIPVTIEKREHFYQALETALIHLKVLDPKKPRQMMVRLRRLFDRSQITSEELQILYGLLRGIEENLLQLPSH